MQILTPISPKTRTDIVTEKIREAIVRGRLEPCEMLTEPSLASLLGVSRSPVREALRRLENEGLVVRDINNSFSVWNPSEKDVDEILSLRVMIESLAAEIMIDKLTDKDFANLRGINDLQKLAIEENRHLTLTQTDRKFHDYLILCCDHSRLLETWNRIMGQWEVLLYRRLENIPQVSETILPDHQNIIDALKSKDLDRVINLHKEINKRVGIEMKRFLRS